MEYLVTAFGAFLMTFLNSLRSEIIHISEYFSIIDSVDFLIRKTMLHISSTNSLEHSSLIFHGNGLAISCFFFNIFFLKVNCGLQLCVIYVREDNDSNVQAMIKRLVWAIWTLMSAVPKKAVKLNHSFTLAISGKNLFETIVITFLETSKSAGKLVGSITYGWHGTFWPSVNMQHWPSRLPWDNL